MKNRVAVGLCLLWTLGAGSLAAADRTTIRQFITEPATLVSLGFEWRIDGDDNRNAVVSVSYRKKGEQTWKEGLPLLRIGNERINENALQYVTPNGCAGSIFDLEPATDYECRFVMADSDGIDGRTTQILSVRTRPEPKPAEGGRTYHVYPPGYNGQKQEPAFTGLLSAYYTGSSHSDNFNTYPARVQPGDTILVHAGIYKDDRYRYGGGLGTVSSGTYSLTQSGTAEKPIVIKGAGDGESVFDGDGAYNLFNVLAANFNYFEGLTIRNTDLAFQGGLKSITGSSGPTIKKCRFENVGRAVYTDWSGSKNYSIADNVMVGRFNPNYLMGFTGRTWQNLPEFSQATGQDRHSVLVDYDVFVRVSAPGPDPRTLYKPSDFDFQLRTGSAVDAGVRLPGVNDDFTGRTPDLGAYEVGRPLPHYGPRP